MAFFFPLSVVYHGYGGKRFRMSIQALADLVHPRSSRHKLLGIMELRAYCDESGMHGDPQFFVVCGYVGRANEWIHLEDRWTNLLRRHQLAEFKASDCEHGQGVFKGKSPREREELQRKFYSLITKFALHGAASSIVMADYNALLPRLAKIRQTEKYTKSPYFIAFEHVLAALASIASNYPKKEQIAFIFDRQKQVQGRAKELYDLAIQHFDETTLSYYHRLGTLAFSSRLEVIPLQVADVLAYESYKYLVEHRFGSKERRWKMDILLQRDLVGRLIDQQFLEELCSSCGA